MTSKPTSSKKKSIIVISWIIPIIALIISYDMVKEHFSKKGDVISIYVKDIKGLNIRKSHIEYKGVQIGKLLSIEPDKNDITRFKIDAMLFSKFNYLVTKGSQFWVVAPKFSIEKIENVGTVLTGNYIELIPATFDVNKLKALPKQNSFTALDDKPLDLGNLITLKSKNGKIAIGASIVYKGLKVGSVIDKELSGMEISYHINIEKKYEHLLNSNTYFYELSPVDMKLSLEEGLSVKMAALKDFLHGSIALVVDNEIKDKNNRAIYENIDELYYDQRVVKLTCDENFHLKKLYINNEEVAKVVSSSYDINSSKKSVDIKFKEKYSYILNTNPKFYLVKSFFDIKKIDIKKMIQGDRLIVRQGNSKDLLLKKEYKIKVLDKNKKKNGFKLIVQGDSLVKDEGVYFKNIEVGYVKEVYLKDDIKFANLIIYHKYKKIINDSTKFYKIKDLKADLSLDGVKVEISSFRQMLEGGVSFITYDRSKKLTETLFELYDSKSDIEEYLEQKNYFHVTLNLTNLYNIKKTSKLYYENLPIGSVEDIYYKGGIKVKVKVKNSFKKLFGRSSKIYLEGIQLSLEKVKNISTEILGDRLHLVASKNDGFKSNYFLDSYNPIDTKYEKGLRVIVKHKTGKNISINAPVYYNYFQIGIIEDIRLNKKTNDIESILFIKDQYKTYIRNTSKFYETSIIDMDLGFLSAKIKVGTIKSLLKGGIDLVNEKEYKSLAKDFDIYKVKTYDEDKKK